MSMTSQEVFDKVVAHLRQQNAKSIKFLSNAQAYEGNPICVYRGEEDRKCAVAASFWKRSTIPIGITGQGPAWMTSSIGVAPSESEWEWRTEGFYANCKTFTITSPFRNGKRGSKAWHSGGDWSTRHGWDHEKPHAGTSQCLGSPCRRKRKPDRLGVGGAGTRRHCQCQGKTPRRCRTLSDHSSAVLRTDRRLSEHSMPFGSGNAPKGKRKTFGGRSTSTDEQKPWVER